jgi:hypothetical protein
VSRPRLTLRVRLTLLYSGLFAGCGAVVVAVSYTLVARLAPGQPAASSRDVPDLVAAQCRSEQPGPRPDKTLIAACINYLEQRGAQSQRELTLAHLLQYSLVSTRAAAGGGELVVANTGPAVDAADVGRIFQPFERLADRTSRDGSGLGLAIVASIAAMHGGTAVARPRRDGGLSVTVTIPAAA